MASVFHTCRRCGWPLYCKTRSYCGALKSLHDSTVISFITPQHAPNQTWTLTILPLVCRFVAGAEVGGGSKKQQRNIGGWVQFDFWCCRSPEVEQIWRVRAVKRRWIHRGLLREMEGTTGADMRGV